MPEPLSTGFPGMDAQHDFIRARHRVSVARALGRTDIDAYVTEVVTRVDLDRTMQTAVLWLETEYRPIVAMLRQAGLIGDRTDAEAYMRVAGERCWLLRTHEWSDVVLQHVIEGKGRWRHPEG
jgi:hypothetical protein